MAMKLMAWTCICAQFLIIYNYAVRLREQQAQISALQEHVTVVNNVMRDLQKQYQSLDNIRDTVQNEIISALKDSEAFKAWSNTIVPFDTHKLLQRQDNSPTHP